MYLQLILISHLFLYCNYIIFLFWEIILFSFCCDVLAAHFDFTTFFYIVIILFSFFVIIFI